MGLIFHPHDSGFNLSSFDIGPKYALWNKNQEISPILELAQSKDVATFR